jgi:TolB-like protein
LDRDESSPSSPEDVDKRSIAVLDFTVHTSADPRVRREFATNVLTDKLTSALVQTRKFRVVERQRVEGLLKEFKLTDQGFTDSKFAVKAGEMVGADFLLMGSISQLDASAKVEKVPYTNESVTTMSGRVAANMHIVDSRTGEVVAAWPVEVSKARTGAVNREALLDGLEQELATKLVERVLGAVYPIKVAEIGPDGTLYLNRGQGGGLKVGDVVEVFETGKSIVDPDTKELLGASEVKVGSARVTEVRARVTTAAVIQGRIPAGAIVRPQSNATNVGVGSGALTSRRKLNW